MEVVKFADIVTRVNTKEDRFNTDKIYYVGGDHIDSNEMMVHQRGIIKGSTIGPMFYCGFKAGDILFVTRNPHLRKCAVVDFDGICSEKTFVLATKDPSRLLQEYLALVMQSDDFWNYCEENKSGGVNFFLNWSTLADYEFSLPSLEEQKILADKLWAAYRVKESYRTLLATTDDMLKAKFNDMFSQEEIMTLGNLAESWTKGQAFRKDDIVEDGKTPCIHYGQLYQYGPVIEKVLSYTNAEAVRPSKVGDILFPASDVTPKGLARCSCINKSGVVLGGDIIIFHPLEGLNSAYLSYAINQQTQQLLSLVTGSVVRHMSAKSLQTVRIPVPCKENQDKFVAIATQAEDTKASLRQSIDAIDRVIRSLINQ